MELSKEIELVTNNHPGLEKVNYQELLQVAWIHWKLVLGGHNRKDLATTESAQPVCDLCVRALVKSNLEYDAANSTKISRRNSIKWQILKSHKVKVYELPECLYLPSCM